MGDMNNNPNDGNKLDTSPVTPENQESMDINTSDSTSQSNENETEEFTYVESPYEQSYETITEVPSAKRPKPKLIAAIIIIAVLLAGSVYAYANRNTFSNTIALMTKSPQEYYSSIEKKSVNKGIDSFTASYDKYLKQYQKQNTSGVAMEADVKLTVNPQFTGLMGLDDFKSIEAKITTLSKNNNGKINVGISYNDQSLVTVNTLENSETGEFFVNVPELSSAYLLLSLEELMSSTGETIYGYSYSEYMKEVEAFLNDESVSPEVLNTLLKKYSALIIDNIDNMKLDKNVSITASKIDSTYNMLTSELKEEDIYNITMAILNEAKNDEIVKNLLVTLNACTAEEYAQLIDTAITDLTDSKDTESSMSDPVLMHVYIDKTGTIMGREFTTSEEGKASGGGYYLARKGTDIGFTAWIKESGKNILEFTGDGSLSSNGFDGTSVLSYSEYSADYDDFTTYSFNIAAEKANIIKSKGYLNGKFTITSDLLMGAEIVMDCKSDEQQQNVKFQVLYGGIDAAAVEITGKEGTYEDFEFPSDSDEVYDAVNDIYSYMGTADFEGFLNHAEEITGLDLESLLQLLLYDSMY